MAESPRSSVQERCLLVLPCPSTWFGALGRRVVLGMAPSSSPAAEAALPSATQTDPPASAPTAKPSTASPPRDSLTPGPGPSSATLLRQPPAKAPATDTISECLGTVGGSRCTADGAVGLGRGEAGRSPISIAGGDVLLPVIKCFDHGQHVPPRALATCSTADTSLAGSDPRWVAWWGAELFAAGVGVFCLEVAGFLVVLLLLCEATCFGPGCRGSRALPQACGDAGAGMWPVALCG